jgi:hypothetical protein
MLRRCRSKILRMLYAMSAASSFNFLKLNFVWRAPIKIVEKYECGGNSVMTGTLHEHAKLVHLFI